MNELQALMARQLLNITDTTAVAEGLDTGRARQMTQLEPNGAQQRISARLIEQLGSVEFSIYELESTEPSSEFVRCLDVVLEELKQRRKELESLFQKTATHQQRAHWSEDVVRELDGVTRLLGNFKSSLAPVQSASDSRWDYQITAQSRFQKLISAPLRPERALEEARNSIVAVMATSKRLQASTQPAAALDDVPLAETSGLGQGGWI